MEELTAGSNAGAQERPASGTGVSLRSYLGTIGGWRITGWQGLLLVICLALSLRLAFVGHRSFYGDEILTIEAAKLGLVSDQSELGPPHWHPPLHYTAYNIAWRLGASSEFGWRLPGVFFGVLVSVGVFLTALFAGARRISLVAGIFVAMSPYAVLISQNARWHPVAGGMLAVSCALMTYAVARRKLWAWITAGLLLALAFYTIFLAALITAVLYLVLFVYLAANRKPLTGALISAAVFGCGIFPVLFKASASATVHNLMSQIVEPSWPVVGRGLLLLQNATVGPTVLPWNWIPNFLALVAFGVVAYFFFSGQDRVLRRLRPPLASLLVGWLLVAILLPVASHPKYWLVVLVPISIGAAAGLMNTRPLWLRWTVGVVVIGVMSYGLFNLYTGRQYQYLEFADDWRKLAQEARAVADDETAVLSINRSFVYYYGHEAQDVIDATVARDSLKDLLENLEAERVLVQYSPLSGWSHIDFQALGERVEQGLEDRGYQRKWLRRYGYDPDATIKRRYMAGRSFPDYRHCLTLYV
ncbi:MAG: glycosyltransferase family 39 protein, partial [Armatimonadota bacterium]